MRGIMAVTGRASMQQRGTHERVINGARHASNPGFGASTQRILSFVAERSAQSVRGIVTGRPQIEHRLEPRARFGGQSHRRCWLEFGRRAHACRSRPPRRRQQPAVAVRGLDGVARACAEVERGAHSPSRSRSSRLHDRRLHADRPLDRPRRRAPRSPSASARGCARPARTASRPPRSPSSPPRRAPRARGARNVGRVRVPRARRRAGWNAPARFLPAGTSIAVLPPMLLSTWASTVVGTHTHATPRSRVAAANPEGSPTTRRPGRRPRRREKPYRRRRRPTGASCAALERSPAGTVTSVAAMPSRWRSASRGGPAADVRVRHHDGARGAGGRGRERTEGRERARAAHARTHRGARKAEYEIALTRRTYTSLRARAGA